MFEMFAGVSNELGNALKEELEKAVKKFDKLCADINQMKTDIKIIKSEVIRNAGERETEG
jgi:hypothetical protein